MISDAHATFWKFRTHILILLRMVLRKIKKICRKYFFGFPKLHFLWILRACHFQNHNRQDSTSGNIKNPEIPSDQSIDRNTNFMISNWPDFMWFLTATKKINFLLGCTCRTYFWLHFLQYHCKLRYYHSRSHLE